MDAILYRGPVSKCIEEVVFATGSRAFRCYSPQNPHYYMENGLLRPIDLTSVKTKMSFSDVPMILADKNIVSVGIRTDSEREKLVGLRRDDCQDGSEQLEFSLDSIQFDEKEMSISLSDMTAKSAITSGNDLLLFHKTRQRLRQLVMVANDIKEFRVCYTLHLTGLTITKINGEYYIFNNKGHFRFKLGRPHLIDCTTLEPIDTDGVPYVTHSLTQRKDGTYSYIKESTKEFYDSGMKTPFYIDADTVYSSTADGYVYNSGATTWANIRSGASGTKSSSSTVSSSATGMASRYSSGFYSVWRSFFYFVLNELSGNVESASINTHGVTNAATAMAMKGTQGASLSTSDFSAFSGDSYGDVTWSSSAYNTISFNSTGIADVQSALGGTCKVCVREKAYDYDNNAPSSLINNGCYYADQSGTTYDPYLSITFAADRPRGIFIPIRRMEPYRHIQ